MVYFPRGSSILDDPSSDKNPSIAPVDGSCPMAAVAVPIMQNILALTIGANSGKQTCAIARTCKTFNALQKEIFNPYDPNLLIEAAQDGALAAIKRFLSNDLKNVNAHSLQLAGYQAVAMANKNIEIITQLLSDQRINSLHSTLLTLEQQKFSRLKYQSIIEAIEENNVALIKVLTIWHIITIHENQLLVSVKKTISEGKVEILQELLKDKTFQKIIKIQKKSLINKAIEKQDSQMIKALETVYDFFNLI
jgi:hypothetical protein